jgi:V/A-type H+-transporting ATPase subunit D
MAIMNVNPTRMELTRLKARLKTATRGHKLLKDKLDEMMKRFLDIVRENRRLRLQVEASLTDAYNRFAVAAAVMSPEMLEQSLLYPKQAVSLDMSFANIMSVDVPKYEIRLKNDEPSEIFPYGFAQTSGELDAAISGLNETLELMLRLAEAEKSAQMLASEIEKTRRRVNALEYVMIPDMNDTIRYIVMKLDENERGNLSRLMKVKDMMVQEQMTRERNRQITVNG